MSFIKYLNKWFLTTFRLLPLPTLKRLPLPAYCSLSGSISKSECLPISVFGRESLSSPSRTGSHIPPLFISLSFNPDWDVLLFPGDTIKGRSRECQMLVPAAGIYFRWLTSLSSVLPPSETLTVFPSRSSTWYSVVSKFGVSLLGISFPFKFFINTWSPT